jgi:FlaA1/EpsC-like NDP-sugar epimerase
MIDKLYKINSRFFELERWKKSAALAAFDALLVAICFLLAFFARVETLDYLSRIDTLIGCLIAILTTLSTFFLRGLYSEFTRYFSITAVLTIVIGSGLSATVLVSSVYLLDLQIPRSVPLIHATPFCFFAIALRYTIRFLSQNRTRRNRVNVAIYGIDNLSAPLVSALKWSSDYRLLQFIDEDPKLQGQTFSGVSIDGFDKAKAKIKSLRIEMLLVAIPITSGDTRNKILSLLSEYPLKVKYIPSVSALIAGTTDIGNLQGIHIEDLLGRKPVEPIPQLMAKTISKKTVLVTGAGGSIGSELCRKILESSPFHLILFDISEYATYQLLQELQGIQETKTEIKTKITPIIGSVQDSLTVKQVFNTFRVDTVYHAAAYKHVSLMELNVLQCVANNVFGTLNVAEQAVAAKVTSFTLVSTDKAVNPTTIMGASKRISELACEAITNTTEWTTFSIVRFGNVLGSSGSVVPLFEKQVKAGGPITLTDPEVTRYFMTIPEAAELVIQASAIAEGGEIFVLDMGEPIKIIDLAMKIVRLSGKRPVLDACESKDGDILIKTVGLRHGEKLHEQLSFGTNLTPTVHPRIRKASENPMHPKELQMLISDLRLALSNFDCPELFSVINSVIQDVSDLQTTEDLFVRSGQRTQGDLTPTNS